MKEEKKASSSAHRDEDVHQVLQRGQLGDQLLHHLAERLEYAVVVDGRQVYAEVDVVHA